MYGCLYAAFVAGKFQARDPVIGPENWGTSFYSAAWTFFAVFVVVGCFLPINKTECFRAHFNRLLTGSVRKADKRVKNKRFFWGHAGSHPTESPRIAVLAAIRI